METTETNNEKAETKNEKEELTPTQILNKRVRAAAFFGGTVGAPIGAWIGYEFGLKRGLTGVNIVRYTMRRLLYGSLAFGSFMIAGVLINFRQQ